MKLSMQLDNFEWWLWAITLVGIILALAGFLSGYYAVIAISAFQIIYFWFKQKSLSAFDTQVRIVYFLLALVGLIEFIAFYFYIALFLGTVMVVFFGRCSIAMVLRKMPWNKAEYCDLENRPST
ncbi:MAG: hypothetical protein OEY34_04945 [Cyclobacteriaceae bacterium]|nr:hypothetical protein [Cyclobacteriaceae bacterium]